MREIDGRMHVLETPIHADYALIQAHARLLVDSRGKYRASQANVIKA